ncbi:MAG: NAD(P)H-dependent oxidoreductase [Acholeplasma sp.]|nr:NAD(P)H-dependent oxidoreductase [Acholeplasma sp.]
MKVIGIVGSVFGSKTRIDLNEIKFSADIEYEIIDLSDYKDLPFADGRVLIDYDAKVVDVINKIIFADALIIGTPIYQASIPGVLKNLFDLMPSDTLINKVVGVVATAGSARHYLVPEYQLMPILNYMKTTVINKYVFITPESFNGNNISDDGIMIRLESLVDSITKKVKEKIEQEAKFDF